MTVQRLPALALCLLSTIGCDAITSVGRPLTVDLTAPKTSVVVGESLLFRVHATGSSLRGAIIDFGDGVADTTAFGGAVTARADFPHEFGSAGSFHVVATVIEDVGPQVRDSITIQVTEPPAAARR